MNCTRLGQVVSAHLRLRGAGLDNYYTTRLTVRTTDELKGAYLGLCKAKGVVASDEIRAFMVSELEKALQDNWRGKIADTATRVRTEGRQAQKPVKCDDTSDMFDAESR